MAAAIIGRKVGMTQIFVTEERVTEKAKGEKKKTGDNKNIVIDTKLIPVTVIEAGPNTIVQVKTTENDGYEAYKLGYGEVSAKHLTKPEQGVFNKADIGFKKHLREFDKDQLTGEYKVGDIVKADAFAVGAFVDAHGTSKGKGFQGAIKRHGQHRLKETHGTGPVVRHAGSMGANSDPSRIFKGKKLPGHMGAKGSSVQNLQIVKIDAENNLIAVKGAVPGPNGGIVTLTSAVKKK
ncbi:MAG: 50S ribosomal protein L3 [Oscillospiraceae bacterium]|nr:50S ribosomal protein L3 [Oscillospiraceae bacterium]